MTRLVDKNALVTGASRGIGRATALALANEGAHVLVHYGRRESEAAAVVAQIREQGGRADTVGADLSESQGPHELARHVRTLLDDRLDILVCNAGISLYGQIEETKLPEFDQLFAVNVRAPSPPTMRAGLPATPCTSMGARSSEARRSDISRWPMRLAAHPRTAWAQKVPNAPSAPV